MGFWARPGFGFDRRTTLLRRGLSGKRTPTHGAGRPLVSLHDTLAFRERGCPFLRSHRLDRSPGISGSIPPGPRAMADTFFVKEIWLRFGGHRRAAIMWYHFGCLMLAPRWLFRRVGKHSSKPSPCEWCSGSSTEGARAALHQGGDSALPGKPRVDRCISSPTAISTPSGSRSASTASFPLNSRAETGSGWFVLNRPHAAGG